MDVIIRTVVKAVFPFCLVLGIFTMFHGHLTPGGSFPGGAIAASGIALLVVALGSEKAENIIRENTAHVLEGIAGILILSVVAYEASIRMFFGSGGEAFSLWSGQQVLLLNIFGGIMVVMALTSIVLLMTKEG